VVVSRTATALTGDRVRNGDRTVPAPPVLPAGGSANSVEGARPDALANLVRTFESMQQPKYTAAKRKSVRDVLRTAGVHAWRTGANVQIHGSENPYSVRSGAQLRTVGLKRIHIFDAGLALKVRDPLNAFFCAPRNFFGQALTAKSLERSTLVPTLMGSADSFDLKTISVRAALTQFVTELCRGIEGLQTLLNVHFIDLS